MGLFLFILSGALNITIRHKQKFQNFQKNILEKKEKNGYL